jgi:hypothetical protein
VPIMHRKHTADNCPPSYIQTSIDKWRPMPKGRPSSPLLQKCNLEFHFDLILYFYGSSGNRHGCDSESGLL